MSKSKVNKEVDQLIKVRLDSKTIITIKDMDLFEQWKERFPNAKVIS